MIGIALEGITKPGDTAMTPEARLAAMGLTLPEVPKPLGNFVPFKIDGNTLYLSGEGPRRSDGSASQSARISGPAQNTRSMPQARIGSRSSRCIAAPSGPSSSMSPSTAMRRPRRPSGDWPSSASAARIDAGLAL